MAQALARALTAVDIYVSVVAMFAHGIKMELVIAFIFGVALMISFLIADGVIGTWRDRRDEEEDRERLAKARNRAAAIRHMSDPLNGRVFPADEEERRRK